MTRGFISLLISILFPKVRPNVTNLRSAQSDDLYPDGLTMGTIVMGKQGSGKTSWLARIIVWLMKQSPRRSFFVLDPSGSLTNAVLYLILQEPYEMREWLLNRVIYMELGNKDIVVPLPSFSHLYGTSYEEQAQLLALCFQRLAPDLVANAPVLGGIGLKEIAPELFRLLCAIQNERGESWQVTEAKRLLLDHGMLRRALNKVGGKVPESKWFFEQDFLNKDKSRQERELRTFTLRAMLGMVEPREARAMLGYMRPAFTPKAAMEQGKLVLVNGQKLNNQQPTQHILFTFIFLLILSAINQRNPDDPKNQPVTIVADEVYALLKIPGMAEEIGKLAPLYRSRKVELIIVLQALWQLEEELQEKIWNLGNRVCFALENFNEAYTFAQQNFHYDPRNVKSPSTADHQHSLYETDRGAYLEQANWLQSLKHRELVIRRYINEQTLDSYVRHVARTTEIPRTNLDGSVEELKKRLLGVIGIPVKDALTEINNRKLDTAAARPPMV